MGNDNEYVRIENYILGTVSQLDSQCNSLENDPIKGAEIGIMCGREYAYSFEGFPVSNGRENAIRGLEKSFIQEEELNHKHLICNGSEEKEIPENIPDNRKRFYHGFYHGFKDSLKIFTDFPNPEDHILRVMSYLNFD